MTATSREHPVLVVGAGPAGLTAAIELSRLGVSVRIIDKAAQPSATSKALAIQARTLELLTQRGIGEEMVRLGNRAKRTTLYGRGKRLAAVDLERIPSRHNYVLLLAQSETERLLNEELQRQGVTVERGVEMVSFTQDEGTGSVQAVLQSGDNTSETVETTYLISAEGARSSARQALKQSFNGDELDISYALGDLHLDGDIPEDQLSVFLGSDSFMAVFPMSGHRFRFMATDPAKHTRNSPPPTLEELQSLYDSVSHIPATLRDANWTSRFWVNSRHMDTLRVGNVFFGGDAAHIHSPAGGQGMNTGIQDMINLCWKLAMVIKGYAGQDLLDTYGSDRLPVISSLVRTTETATKAFNSTNPLVHQLLTRIAPIALSMNKPQDNGTRVLGQVAATYRKSPLASGGGRVGKLHAGDRVPDVDIMEAPDSGGGQSGADAKRLYGLLDLEKFTLLVTDPSLDTDAITGQLKDWVDIVTVRRVTIPLAQPALRGSDAAIARDLTDQSPLLLVRPDAYLAAAGTATAPLATWLGTWFPCSAA